MRMQTLAESKELSNIDDTFTYNTTQTNAPVNNSNIHLFYLILIESTYEIMVNAVDMS